MSAAPKLSLAICAGSVAGREHVRLGRNNQDGVALHAEEGLLVAVVTDGCSSGRSSEVGARLGAAFLAHWLPVLWRKLGQARSSPDELTREAGEALLAYLETVATGLGPHPEDRRASLADFLLFSFLGAVVDCERAFIFGMGDGVFSVNGSTTVLDAGPNNAPDYLAYRLAAVADRSSAPRVHCCLPTAQLSCLMVGTDGLIDLEARAGEPLRDGAPQGGLLQFANEAGYLRNPVALQRRLNVIGEVNRRLPDDTTLALLRRREESP